MYHKSLTLKCQLFYEGHLENFTKKEKREEQISVFRSLTSFCRSGNLGEVSVENNLRHEHFIYEEGKKNENFEAVWGYFWRLLDQPGD